ncbi:hypothetical protein GQ600_3984 [Phytophthora cactorum]|nr:hypothetical protein GQ600_3984 [Phytophthora cactorum]
MTHVQDMCNLHLQLIALTGTTWEDVRVEEAEEESVQDTEPGAHSPKQNDDWRDHSGQRKKVQRNCKVCVMRAKGKRGATTTYTCDSWDFVGRYSCAIYCDFGRHEGQVQGAHGEEYKLPRCSVRKLYGDLCSHNIDYEKQRQDAVE